jgi:hypothetical protein
MIIDELFEGPQLCPECGGISFSDLILAEKKDACYYKVKASAKVWPSAYASGRLVQCRKKGAANYGNKSEGVAEGSKMARVDKLAKAPKPKNQQEYDAIEKYRKDLAQSYKSKKQQGVAEGSEESYIIIRTDAEGKKDMFAKFSTYEKAQKELDGLLDHPLHTKYKQKFEIKRKGGEQGVAETRRGQIPMTLNTGETDNLEPEDFAGFKKLPAYQQGQAAQQKAGKQLIQKSPYTFQSDQDWAYRQGATDAQRAAMFANFGGTKPLTTAEGEQQPGADYRDPNERDYDDEYDAMVARVKKLAGLGPMKTVYDPNKRVYRNMPTAQQPKKQ